jgi:hypothetical protein
MPVQEHEILLTPKRIDVFVARAIYPEEHITGCKYCTVPPPICALPVRVIHNAMFQLGTKHLPHALPLDGRDAHCKTNVFSVLLTLINAKPSKQFAPARISWIPVECKEAEKTDTARASIPC